MDPEEPEVEEPKVEGAQVAEKMNHSGLFAGLRARAQFLALIGVVVIGLALALALGMRPMDKEPTRTPVTTVLRYEISPSNFSALDLEAMVNQGRKVMPPATLPAHPQSFPHPLSAALSPPYPCALRGG